MASVSSLSSTGTQGATLAGKGLSGMSGEDFMNLLITQLANQDPLQPMSNEEMLNQISTIRQVEMNSRLTERLEQLTELQRFGASTSLIGKKVKGTVKDEAGNEYTKEGVVTSVIYSSDGQISLQLDTGDTLPLASLDEVADGYSKTPVATPQKTVVAA